MFQVAEGVTPASAPRAGSVSRRAQRLAAATSRAVSQQSDGTHSKAEYRQLDDKDLTAKLDQLQRTLNIEREARLELEREFRSAITDGWKPARLAQSPAPDSTNSPLHAALADLCRTVHAQQQQIDALSSQKVDEGRLLQRWATEYDKLIKTSIDRHVLDLKATLAQDAQQAQDRLEMIVIGIRDDLTSDRRTIHATVTEALETQGVQLQKKQKLWAKEKKVLLDKVVQLSGQVDALMVSEKENQEHASEAAAQIAEAVERERTTSREIASLLRQEINNVRDDTMTKAIAMETTIRQLADKFAQPRMSMVHDAPLALPPQLVAQPEHCDLDVAVFNHIVTDGSDLLSSDEFSQLVPFLRESVLPGTEDEAALQALEDLSADGLLLEEFVEWWSQYPICRESIFRRVVDQIKNG